MMQSPYDPIAEMYDRNWDQWYLPEALPALEKLFFEAVPAGSRVLDVCCGSAHVTRELLTRGYNVTGVDNSEEMVRRAKAKCPRTNFVVQDVRALGFRNCFDAAISTFDSLNHLLNEADLQASLEQVRATLRAGGMFVFDLNGADAYRLDMSRWHTNIDEESVSLVRGSYDPATKVGSTELIWFGRAGGQLWRRQSSTVKERCYEAGEALMLLQAAGYSRVEAIGSVEAGVSGDLALGRTYFRAWA